VVAGEVAEVMKVSFTGIGRAGRRDMRRYIGGASNCSGGVCSARIAPILSENGARRKARRRRGRGCVKVGHR
jgi:hypothetical protein